MRSVDHRLRKVQQNQKLAGMFITIWRATVDEDDGEPVEPGLGQPE
jgi:hypothetical protein